MFLCVGVGEREGVGRGREEEGEREEGQRGEGRWRVREEVNGYELGTLVGVNTRRHEV